MNILVIFCDAGWIRPFNIYSNTRNIYNKYFSSNLQHTQWILILEVYIVRYSFRSIIYFYTIFFYTLQRYKKSKTVSFKVYRMDFWKSDLKTLDVQKYLFFSNSLDITDVMNAETSEVKLFRVFTIK